MVEQATSPAALDFESAAEKKARMIDDQAIVSSITDLLKNYTPPEPSAVKDTLSSRYKLDCNSPLSEYDTKNAKAYAASDLLDDSKKLIALVCRINTVQRHYAIQILKGYEHPNLLTLHAAGVVTLSQPDEERFTLFYSRPNGKKLSNLIASLDSPLNDAFINKNILSPIVSAIGHLVELGIPHGAIRPENIYYGDCVILGECITETCGHSQPFYFDSIDRMQAIPSAKGEGNVSQDYYALAILALYLLYGQNHFSSYTRETLASRILKDGAYVALMRGKEPPEDFNDFLRGLLSGKINERWNYKNLKQWIGGKRANIMLPASPTEALKPFEFNAVQGFTKRELAHLFFKDWDKTIELLKTDDLTYWVTVSLRNKDLAESLKKIKRIISDAPEKNKIQTSEQLMLLLLLFDPNGPIRINNLSFNLDGIDGLCIELINNKSIEDLLLLAKYIEQSMSSHWLELQRAGREYVMPKSINDISMKIDRLRLFIRNTGYGFGSERMLYELNPELPCQSPLFANHYVNNIQSLLIQLDRLAPKLYKEQDPIDRHIAAFIANRLGILHDIKLPELIPHPSLATDSAILSLRLISMAQDRSRSLQLPGLTCWLALRIMPALDILKSNTLRSRIKDLISDRSKSGYTQLLAELLIHSNYAIADVSGFGRAKIAYKNNIAEIAYYKNEKTIKIESKKLGLFVAKIIAYMMFLLFLASAWGLI